MDEFFCSLRLTPREVSTVALALGAGFLLGIFFFGGLWWTVQRTASSKQPAIIVLVSVVVRMTVALLGFYLVSGPHWGRLLLCLLGFLIARVIVTWQTRPSDGLRTSARVPHAP